MQPDLFQWSPPAPVAAPTVEPTPEKFRRASRIGALIEQWALESAASGRVEVNALFARLRATLRVTLDNSTRAACSDWLIERNPELAAVIKRRARKRTAAKAVAP